jgi:hypothetical protein
MVLYAIIGAMANKVKRIVRSDRDRAELRRRVASKSLPAREVERARIVLLAEEALAARDVSELVSCSEPTVLKGESLSHAAAGSMVTW